MWRFTGWNYCGYNLIAGVLQLHRSGLTAFRFWHVVDESCGIEEDGLTAHEDNEGGVIIPETNFALTDEHMLQLYPAFFAGVTALAYIHL